MSGLDSTAQVELVERIARQRHAGQTDKGGHPYIGHPQRVAAMVSSPLERTVAWLHDTVEDTGYTENMMRADGFDEQVIETVTGNNQCHKRKGAAMRRRVTGMCAGLLAGVILCAAAMPAHADELDSLWPVTQVEQAHQQGLDGSGIKVAVIDSLSVNHPGLADADITHEVGAFDDMDGNPVQCRIGGWDLQATVEPGERGWYYTHGTDMLLWFAGNGMDYDNQPGYKGIAPGATILHIANSEQVAGMSLNQLCDADMYGDVNIDAGSEVSRAVDWGARIISRSQGTTGFGGADVGADDIEDYVDALRHGVIMVSGRANDTEVRQRDLTGVPLQSEYFPGVITVNNIGPDGSIAPTSDTVDGNIAVLSPGNDVLEPSNQLAPNTLTVGNGGTSTATAVLSGYLTLAMQKWPDATGNQIIQSLIRNTKEGDGQGDPTLDPERKRGFGEVDPQKLLSVDPTQYPDINPILEYEVKAAAQYDRSKDWYTQDCSSNPDGIRDEEIGLPVPCETGLIGREYERQRAAWDKVEQCRADGGTDCMKFSATNTADTAATDGDESPSPDSGEGLPAWVWAVIGGGVLIVIAGIVIAIIALSRRSGGRRPQTGGYPAQPYQGQVYPTQPYQGRPGGYSQQQYPAQQGRYPQTGQRYPAQPGGYSQQPYPQMGQQQRPYPRQYQQSPYPPANPVGRNSNPDQRGGRQ